MPTAKPRIQVTMKPESYRTVTRLAQLQGRSRSSVLAELVDDLVPVLQRVVVVGEASQHAQADLKAGLLRSVEAAEAQVLPHAARAMAQFDWMVADVLEGLGAAQRPAEPASELPPTPVPVTRGSGLSDDHHANKKRRGKSS